MERRPCHRRKYHAARSYGATCAAGREIRAGENAGARKAEESKQHADLLRKAAVTHAAVNTGQPDERD